MRSTDAANPPYRLPPPLCSARCLACWFIAALLVLVVASFWSLDLQWSQLLSLDALRSMGRFLGEFYPPDTHPDFLRKVPVGTWETLAMSAFGTLLAAVGGLLLALPASRTHADDPARARSPTRFLLNVLRSIPELVWAGAVPHGPVPHGQDRHHPGRDAGPGGAGRCAQSGLPAVAHPMSAWPPRRGPEAGP